MSSATLRSVARGLLLSAAVFFLLLCPSVLSQSCNGASLTIGPNATFAAQYYWPSADELLGTPRVLTSTQQVNGLQQSFEWFNSSINYKPVTITLALYGPPTCGNQGDSQLLSVGNPYTFAAGGLSSGYIYTVTVNLPTPLVLPAATYYIMIDSDTPGISILSQAVTGINLYADSYPYNSTNVAFPNTTLLSIYSTGQDTNAALLTTNCTSATSLTTIPACTPRPFVTYPATPEAVLPCGASSAVYVNTFSYNSALPYNYQTGAATDTVRLIPTLVSTSMTIYSISLLIHPDTSAAPIYTFRPALYTMNGTNSFSLLAQANQTIIPGTALRGQFTEVYFPLQTPVTVAAGTTVYLNRLVDQTGVVLVFDISGGTFTSSGYAITSNQSAPASITTTGTGGVDASRGLLGCPAAVQPVTGTCSGQTFVNGPAAAFVSQYYWPSADELLGTPRTLTSTQQVIALQQTFDWYNSSINYKPVTITLALYGPATCGNQGDSQLLAIATPYTFPVGGLATGYAYTINASFPTPFILPAGTYTVMIDSDTPGISILSQTSTTGVNLVADSYPYNSTNVAFPNTTLLSIYSTGQDTNAAIISVNCTTPAALTVFPTCTPRPYVTYPATPEAALPCSSSSYVYTNTYSYNASFPYVYQSGAAIDTVRLIPTLITQSQTIYTVSLLVHPDTSAAPIYTFRPALYTMNGTNSFSLIAQASQTIIPGTALRGQFTEVYFPLQTPVYVTAGTTVYLNRLVDQAGLSLVFDLSGTTFTSSSYAITSNQSAPASITTSGTGGIDASRGFLGCLGQPAAGSSSSGVPAAVSGAATSVRAASSSAAATSTPSTTSAVVSPTSVVVSPTSAPVVSPTSVAAATSRPAATSAVTVTSAPLATSVPAGATSAPAVIVSSAAPVLSTAAPATPTGPASPTAAGTSTADNGNPAPVLNAAAHTTAAAVTIAALFALLTLAL